MQLKYLVRDVGYICLKPFRAVPWLWQSVAGLSLAETRLSIWPAHVEFVVDEVRMIIHSCRQNLVQHFINPSVALVFKL
jgi:hypothetical protein